MKQEIIRHYGTHMSPRRKAFRSFYRRCIALVSVVAIMAFIVDLTLIRVNSPSLSVGVLFIDYIGIFLVHGTFVQMSKTQFIKEDADHTDKLWDDFRGAIDAFEGQGDIK